MDNRGLFATTVLVLGILAPLILLSSSAFPAIDDFPCSLSARDAGLITSVVTWYKIWTARYFSVLMWWLCPLVWGWEKGYQLAAPAVIIGHFLSLLGFLYLFRRFIVLKWAGRVTLALVVTALYFTIIPSIPEGLYYYNGLVCYQPAAMFLLLLLGLLVRLWGATLSEGFLVWVKLIIAGGLVFCIVGSNESAMLSITLIIMVFCAYFTVVEKRFSWIYGLLVLEVVILDLFVLLSPATTLRLAASASDSHQLSWVFTQSLFYASQFLLGLLQNPFFYLLSFLVYLLIPVNQGLPAGFKLLVLLLSGTWIIAHIPSFKGEGAVQGRTANFIVFVFLLAWLTILYYLKARQILRILSIFSMVSFSVILLLFQLFFFPSIHNNITQAYRDLGSGVAAFHRQEVLARINYIRSSRSDSIIVLPYQYFPSSTFVSDLEPVGGNIAHNTFYARYFGKKYIELGTNGIGNRKPD